MDDLDGRFYGIERFDTVFERYGCNRRLTVTATWIDWFVWAVLLMPVCVVRHLHIVSSGANNSL